MQQQNKKLKILLINRWLGYNYGGNESIMHDILRWFSKDHKVTVITTKGEELEPYTLVKKEYINAPTGYYTYGVFGVFFSLLFLLKVFLKVLVLHLKGERFDLVSVHFSLEALLARFIKLFFNIPYVYVVAGDTYLEMIEAKRANGVVHICDFMNNQGKKFNHNSVVIPVGIDTNRFNPSKYSNDLRNKYLKSHNEKLSVSVCRLDPRKSLVTIVEAMDILVNQKNIKNIKHVMVGGGIEEEFLKNKIKEYKLENYVFLAGRVSEEELPIYHASADLFVLPTLYETFGIVYTEAMASGTPVLTTKVGAAPEVVSDAGILIEPKNPEKLAKKIFELLSNENKLIELKEKGLKRAQIYEWHNVMKQYEDYYIKVSETKNTCLDRFKVLLEFGLDIFLIIKVLFTTVLFTKKTKDTSSWDGSGHTSFN